MSKLILYEDGIRNQFFVALRAGAGGAPGHETEILASQIATRYQGNILYLYSPDLRLFALQIDVENARRLAQDSEGVDADVVMIEQDRPAYSPPIFPFPGRGEKFLKFFKKLLFPSPVLSWGLDRIDQNPGNQQFDTPNDGSGVTVYVIDTGINDPNGTIFYGRLHQGKSFYPPQSTGTYDFDDHGTPVAGVIGSQLYGVAKAVALIPIRVWSRSGSACSIAAGVDYVRHNAVSPAVANISLSAGYSQCLNRVVSSAITAGITCVVAAGDGNRDVSGVSPAGVPGAITVTASTRSNSRLTGSNYGSLVDFLAPGIDIPSFHKNGSPGDKFYATSIATGFVTGAAAVYLAANTNANPCQVHSALVGGGETLPITMPPKLLIRLV